jgi:type I restriction enzyme S subunit
MIGGLKPYPEYKESGVLWLGKIPSHWTLERAKWLFHRMDRPARAEDHVVTCFRDGVVTLRKNRRLRGFTESVKEIGYQGIRRGDLVIHAMDAFAGAVGVSDSDGKGTPVYSVCRPRPGADPNYYAEVVRAMARSQWILALSKGIRERSTDFRFQTFGRQIVPIPPEDEQRAMVRFFTAVDAQCRRLTRTKRKLIALLNEEKQAIIHRAVTRGLDPNIRLKASGVTWLGQIPEHWDLKRFKFVALISSGQVDPRRSPYRDLTLIAPNHIESGSGKLLFEETAGEQGADSGKYLATKGSVLYSKIRPNLRKAVIAPRDCLCSADMYSLSPRRDWITPEYFVLLLLSVPFTRYVVDCSMRVAMPKVNREALGNCWLWLPPLDEQRSILGAISRETLPIDGAITRAKREINLIREYQNRLIADVVTGQLDVREASRSLPVEMREFKEPFEDEPEELLEAVADHE